MPQNKNDLLLFSLLQPLDLSIELAPIIESVFDELKKIDNLSEENCYTEMEVDEFENTLRITVYKK